MKLFPNNINVSKVHFQETAKTTVLGKRLALLSGYERIIWRESVSVFFPESQYWFWRV